MHTFEVFLQKYFYRFIPFRLFPVGLLGEQRKIYSLPIRPLSSSNLSKHSSSKSAVNSTFFLNSTSFTLAATSYILVRRRYTDYAVYRRFAKMNQKIDLSSFGLPFPRKDLNCVSGIFTWQCGLSAPIAMGQITL